MVINVRINANSKKIFFNNKKNNNKIGLYNKKINNESVNSNCKIIDRITIEIIYQGN